MDFLHFKKIFVTTIIGLSLTGCLGNLPLVQKEIQVPPWYLNTPLNNAVFIYGEGESKISIDDARNNALNTMSSKLVVSVGSSIFTTTTTSRNSKSNNYSKDIRKDVKVDIEKIKFTNAITEKSVQVDENFYILMKVNRQELFENKKKEFDILDNQIQKKYNSLGKYGKLEQINILQTLYPSIEKSKKQAIVLNAINNDFNHVKYMKEYDSYINQITELKENLTIMVTTNKKTRYFSDTLIDMLNQKQYRVSYTQQSDIVVSLNNKVKYSVARGWNIAKVSTSIAVKYKNKIISSSIIKSLGRSSTSKQSALENASENFLEQIEEKTIDKVIFSK